jgi:hypothetical protein
MILEKRLTALEAKTRQEKIVLAYLEENASDVLVEKINSGNKRYATEVIADEANFVDSKQEGSSEGYSPSPKPNAPQNAKHGVSQASFEDADSDQDLPF